MPIVFPIVICKHSILMLSDYILKVSLNVTFYLGKDRIWGKELRKISSSDMRGCLDNLPNPSGTRSCLGSASSLRPQLLPQSRQEPEPPNQLTAPLHPPHRLCSATCQHASLPFLQVGPTSTSAQPPYPVDTADPQLQASPFLLTKFPFQQWVRASSGDAGTAIPTSHIVCELAK